MRKIKFRVWDKDFKRMHICGEDSHDSMGFTFQTNDAYYYNLQNGEGSDPDGTGTYDLMQYTGLKDKNGVEIYEEDIAQITYMNPLTGKPIVDVYRIETQDNGLVKMIHSSREERWHRHLHLQYKEVEVIGNIHEDSILLEGSSSK